MKSNLIARRRKLALSGSEAWVTDRDEKAEAKMPETAEVPRLAAQKKTAQPAAAAAPTRPAAPIAPAGPAPTAAPAPGSPVDPNQMSSESLSKIIKSLADVEMNDKAALALVEEAARTLKGRPVEVVPAEAPKSAAAKTAIHQPGLGEFDPGPAKLEEGMDSNIPHCDRCEMMNLQGMNCHETGCPNDKKTWDPQRLDWVNYNDEEPMEEEMDMSHFGGLSVASVEKEAAEEKVAVAPEGWEGTVKDMKKDEDIDNPWALAWWMKDKGYKHHKKESWKEAQAAMYKDLADRFAKSAAGSQGSGFSTDQDTGKVKEGELPEAAAADKLVDEAPAKLDRTETTLPIKLNGSSKSAGESAKASTALKKVEKLSEKLKEMYLDAKDLTNTNDTRAVREAVEAIFRAYDLLGCAAKVLGKQQMQEDAEAEAVKVKEKGSKKKGSLLDCLVLAGIEDTLDDIRDYPARPVKGIEKKEPRGADYDNDPVTCPSCRSVVNAGGRCKCGKTKN